MRIIHIDELVYSDPRPTTLEERREKHDAILAGLGATIYLGSFIGVQYDVKSDRYAATFAPGDGKKLVLKTSGFAAEFLAANATGKGYWQGSMVAGELVDVYLIQA